MDRHVDRHSHLRGHWRDLLKGRKVLVPHSDDDDDDDYDEHHPSHDLESSRSKSSKFMRTSVGSRHTSWMNAGNRMELLSASIQGKVLVSPWRQKLRQHKAKTQTQTQTQPHTQMQAQTQTEQRGQWQYDPLVQKSKEDLSHVAIKNESTDFIHKFDLESAEHNRLSIASDSPIVSKPSTSWHHQQSDDFLEFTPVQEPPVYYQSFLIATPTSSGAIIASASATGSATSLPPSSIPLRHEENSNRGQMSTESRERPFQRSSSTPNLSSSSLTSEPMKKKNSKRKRRQSQSLASSTSISSSMLVTENLSDIARYLENDLSGTRPSF